jgi:PKD repeat protein
MELTLMQRRIVAIIGTGLLVGILVGGCPRSNAVLVTGQSGPVTAAISASSTRADAAPLDVVFTGADSSSTAGTIVAYAWDFGDGSSGSGVSPAHSFTSPGRFTVTLTVTDSAGNTASAALDIRIAGADTVTAVIQADTTNGAAPLTVMFDGTASSATDDTVTDYDWDFGDGETSISSAPTHIYGFEGTYEVNLTVTTSGGVSAAATPITVIVGPPTGWSLEFDGTELATLPTGLDANAPMVLTFEAWVRSDASGGTIARIGNFVITANAITNSIGAGLGIASISANVPVLDRVWRHVAVTYEDGVGVNIFVDGALLGSGSLSGSTDLSEIVIGEGFGGHIARVALFPEIRPTSSIVADANSSSEPMGNNIVGYWPFSAGGGQTLRNLTNRLLDGVRGSSSDNESIDPSWSTETPTF